MRRVLACLAIAAGACLAALPTANAEPADDTAVQQQGQVVINEVQTRGAGGVMDQFIEIANPSRIDMVDLSGWYLQVYSSHNTVLQTVFLPEGATLLPLGSGPA